MKYVIVTVEWCVSKGIVIPTHARHSLDGKKVIFHYGIVKPILTEEDSIKVYQHDDSELLTILSGCEWSESRGEDMV